MPFKTNKKTGGRSLHPPANRADGFYDLVHDDVVGEVRCQYRVERDDERREAIATTIEIMPRSQWRSSMMALKKTPTVERVPEVIKTITKAEARIIQRYALFSCSPPA